jgi:NADPH-dependent 2,4-dienoyl-CoA reductase/sulfur reductase-like enzyme
VNHFRYLILGGGMVAGYAAREFVARGLAPGELAIVSADAALPYERPPLSKGFLAGHDDDASVSINPESFYREHGIIVRLNSEVTAVDLQARELRLHSEAPVQWEKLLIATGSRVRTLDVPGASAANLFYLRSLADAKRLRSASQLAGSAVVIGGGFIGMEVAAVLAQRGLDVTLLFPGQRVWQRFFTPPMSAFFEQFYREHGVRIVAGESVAAFARDGGKAAAITASGQHLAADMFVAGVGATPTTELFTDSGIELDNGIVVNEYLETTVAAVYAAGDVANYRDLLFGRQRRLEHWDNAVEQGKQAARVMAGDRSPFVHVPYYFSDVFDLSYEFWGDTAGAEQVIYRGDVTSRSFSAWWLSGGRLVAAFVMNRPDEEREAAARWIGEGAVVAADHLETADSVLAQAMT